MITLAIPIYNQERFLHRCLRSILSQTDGDYEVLLIDDGSTDDSPGICDAYVVEHPERIRVIHKPNGGLSSARNAGIEAARGDFIIFPDPDDWVEPDYVEALLHYQRMYGADMVCLGHYVDTDVDSVPSNQRTQTAVMDGQQAQHGLLLEQYMGGFCWNKLYRVDLIRQNNLRFSSELGDTEDLGFTYRYLSFCETVCHIPSRRVYHYYQHRSSSTRRSFSVEKLGTLKTFEMIVSDSAQCDPELAQAAVGKICTEAVNLLWDYEISDTTLAEVRHDLLRHIRNALPQYLMSGDISLGRKFQALLAAVSPGLFVFVKKCVRQHRG